MISRLRSEDGWLVVTAVMMMTIMMGLGLATYSFVDTQTNLSGVERQRESSFNLGEGALNAQAFVLSREWPGNAGAAFPASCTWTTGSGSLDPKCPNATELSRAFSAIDYEAGTTWTVTVRDDYCLDAYEMQEACGGGPGVQFYDPTLVNTRPTWDENDNDQLWVRADAVVRDRPRSLVALMSVEQVAESLPRKTIIAGSLKVHPSGNRTYVETSGQDVALRCSGPGAGCADYAKPKQIDPISAIKYDQYVGEPAVSPEVLARLRERAQADGTYYTTCPASPVGAVVFVEPTSAVACNYNAPGQVQYNSPEEPGLFILTQGTFHIHANDEYFGIVYALNGQGSSGPVVSTGGGGSIRGAVFVDGPGQVEVGSSAPNIIFDPRAFELISSYGVAGVVQNTWREIPAQ